MEAARIDGASDGDSSVDAAARAARDRVARDLPVSGRGTTCSLPSFGRSTQPITPAIFTQLRQFGSNIELIAPAAFVSAYPARRLRAFQRYFVQGLLAGSVK